MCKRECIRMKSIHIFTILKSLRKEQNSAIAAEESGCSPYARQSFAALGPLLLTVVIGMTLGYSAVLLPQLQDPTATPHSIQINREEASWVASLAVIPMAVGTLIGGFLIQKYGRKATHIITSVPFFVGWLLIRFAVNLEMLLTGRFITGLSSGVLGPATGVYIGETTDPKYRGVLLGGIPLSVSVGILATHLLGTFLTWQTTALITSFLPLVSWALMTFSPESPAWLVQRCMLDAAETSWLWLRGSSDRSRQELGQLLARNKENKHLEACKSLREQLKDLGAPEFWKPMLILLVFFVTSQWAGVNGVSFYSVTFMKNTLGDAVDEYLATFIFDCLRLVSSIASCFLLMKIDRRQLALMGGIGTFLPLFTLSCFIYFTKNTHLPSELLAAVPVTCLLTYIFFVTAGFVSLPWNLLGELLPMSKKSLGSGIASFVAYMSIFSVVKTMPVMFESLSAEGTFLVYGAMALVGTLFVYWCLPETRGKTLHDIEEHFKTEGSLAEAKSSAPDVVDVRF